MRMFNLALALPAILYLGLLMMSNFSSAYPVATVIGTITNQPSTPLPDNLTLPDGQDFKFLLYGSGVQVYQCTANSTAGQPGSWTLVGPNAYLVNDVSSDSFDPSMEVAHHYFQATAVNGGRATWESLVQGDTSLVITKIIGQSDSPDGPENIPWLLTQTTSTQPGGQFSDITYVLRVNTQDGVAPSAESCGTDYPNTAKFNSTYTTEYWYFNVATITK